jgi:methanogenic corrinoid protein MtbC1
MADFSSRLRELRVQRGMRQKDLAAVLGLAQTTIANYEQKLRFPDEPTLVRIADFFSVSLDHLMGRAAGEANGNNAPGHPGEAVDGDASLPTRAREYLQALRVGGTEEARAQLLALRAAGVSIRDIYLRVLTPALHEVGRLWALGEMSVGEEHSFSEATQSLMAALAPSAPPTPVPPGLKKRCLVLAASGEGHVIGARMVADLLSMEGFDVRFLGGNVSIGTVRELLRADPCTLLVLSVTLPEHLDAAQDLVRAIRGDRSLGCVKILAGGQAFGGLRPGAESGLGAARIGADAYAPDAEQAAAAAAALWHTVRKQASAK